MERAAPQDIVAGWLNGCLGWNPSFVPSLVTFGKLFRLSESLFPHL